MRIEDVIYSEILRAGFMMPVARIPLIPMFYENE